jgi:hypothetical protein
MENAAASLMGEPVVAGAVVLTKGTTSRMALSGGGMVGGLIAGAVSAARKPPSTPGNHRGHVYVAVGATKVAFFSVKQGLLKQSIQGLLVEHPRADVTAFDVGGALVTSILVVLKDGTNYELECGAMLRGRAHKLKQALAV